MRRALTDRPERSARIVQRLTALDVVVQARRVLVYDSIVGEVETAGLAGWCIEHAIETAVPEDGVDAAWPDVIIVPGTAFTTHGERVGQGGGWYDRFLAGRRDDAVLIGVAFAPQIVESLPTEEHDITLDLVVTEDAVHVAACRSGSESERQGCAADAERLTSLPDQDTHHG